MSGVKPSPIQRSYKTGGTPPTSDNKRKRVGGELTEKKRKLCSNDVQPIVHDMALASMAIKSIPSDITDKLEPSIKQKLLSSLNVINEGISDIALLAKCENHSQPAKLVAAFQRKLFIDKMVDEELDVGKREVYSLLRSYSFSSSPSFKMQSVKNISPDEKERIVRNAFNIRVKVTPNSDKLFLKGIFVRVDKSPFHLLEAYKQRPDEPKTKGKHKKGPAALKETTCNIWQSNLLDNDTVRYKCSLKFLYDKNKKGKLRTNDEFTYVVWMKEEHFDDFLLDSGFKKKRKLDKL